jgi:acetyl esterase/lipase
VKETIRVDVKNEMYALIEGVTFAQVPYWFPFSYKDLKMDVLMPFMKPADGRGNPCIVWICGGGFLTMERGAHVPYLTYYAKHGYTVASIEYRLSNSAVYPAPLEDVKSAIRYLRENAQKFRIDPERVAVMGESAGGYLAAMAGATGNTRKFDTGDNLDQSSEVKAVVDFYGPSGINRAKDGEETIVDRLKPKDIPVTPEERSAVSFMDGTTPPYYLLHGTKDQFIPVSLSEQFYDDMRNRGVEAELTVIEGAMHADPRFYQDEVSEKVLAFLDKYVKGQE